MSKVPDQLFIDFRYECIRSGLLLHADIALRTLAVMTNIDGLQIALEGSPIRGEFVVRWQTSGDAVVWFRPYDTSFAHDFKRIQEYTDVLFTLFQIVKEYNPNLRSLS